MPEVKSPDYQGKDRRNGRAKLKLSVSDYIRIIILISSLAVSGIVAWVKMDMKVIAVAKDVEVGNKIIRNYQDENVEQDKDISKLKSDVQHIKDDVGSIKSQQKDNTQILYKILGKLEDR